MPGMAATVNITFASVNWLAAFNKNEPPNTAATTNKMINQMPIFLELILPSPNPTKKK